MSVTLTISEETYRKLQTTAQIHGKKNVEKLLEDWSDEQFVEREKELARRKEVGDRIRKFQKQMGKKYGLMPDSTELIREDRNR
jgi:hypothetical protein